MSAHDLSSMKRYEWESTVWIHGVRWQMLELRVKDCDGLEGVGIQMYHPDHGQITHVQLASDCEHAYEALRAMRASILAEAINLMLAKRLPPDSDGGLRILC
jgi:hypothetical protein